MNEKLNQALAFCDTQCQFRTQPGPDGLWCSRVGLSFMAEFMTRAVPQSDAEIPVFTYTSGYTEAAADTAGSFTDDYFAPRIIACADNVRAGKKPIADGEE